MLVYGLLQRFISSPNKHETRLKHKNIVGTSEVE